MRITWLINLGIEMYYFSAVIMPLGYRDLTADWLLPMKEVRKSHETIVKQVDESEF